MSREELIQSAKILAKLQVASGILRDIWNMSGTTRSIREAAGLETDELGDVINILAARQQKLHEAMYPNQEGGD